MLERPAKQETLNTQPEPSRRLLHKYSEDWELIFRSITDSVLVLDLDQKVLAVNPATLKITGKEKWQLLGRHCYEILHCLNSPPKGCPHEKLIASGSPATIEMEKEVFFGTCLVTVSPIFDDRGCMNKVLHIAKDITERKRMEKSLQESEHKYRTLFEESRDIVFIATPDGKFVDINPAGIESFGYSSKEELLKIKIDLDLYFSPADWQAGMDVIAEQGYVDNYELALKRKDGRHIVVVVSASAVRDDKGTLMACRGIMRDITKHRQLQQQFFQAQKMESVGALAGGIAHDFNNILTAIMGTAFLAKMKLSTEHPVFKHIDTIEKAATRASDLAAGLLGFARAGKSEMKPVDLTDVVNETLEIIGGTLGKSIEIETRLCSPLPMVKADVTQMQQVIMNLFVNARDAMPQGGKLTIEANIAEHGETPAESKSSSYVALSVIDTGVGMDKETMQKIFEPFFTTKEPGKGTGLGLAVVKTIVNNYGGSIHVFSELGKGSTFKIRLPACEPPKMQAPLQGSKNEIPSSIAGRCTP